jgi:hypothetical protein
MFITVQERLMAAILFIRGHGPLLQAEFAQ